MAAQALLPSRLREGPGVGLSKPGTAPGPPLNPLPQAGGEAYLPCMSWLPPGMRTVSVSSASLSQIWQARREWRVTL